MDRLLYSLVKQKFEIENEMDETEIMPTKEIIKISHEGIGPLLLTRPDLQIPYR